MKSKTFVILLIVCAALGGAAYLLVSGDGRTESASEMGAPLFSSLPVNETARIDIQGPAGQVTLQKGDPVWTVAERSGYPANFDEIVRTVKKLRDAAVGRSFEADEEARARLGLLPPDADAPADQRATRLVLKSEGGDALAEILLGKAREATSGTGGHYLMRETENRIYLVDTSFRSVKTDPAEWIDKSLLKVPAADVRSVAFSRAGETIYRIERPEKGKDPEFTHRPDGYADRTVKTPKLNSLVGVLANFQITDVADPEIPEDEALGDDAVLEYRLFDGTIYRIRPGAAVTGDAETEDADKSYYVTVSADYEAPPEPPAPEPDEAAEAPSDDSAGSGENEADEAETADPADDPAVEAEKRKQEQARLKQAAADLDAKIGKWTYIIPEWRYTNLITDPEDLFEDPADTAADAPQLPEASDLSIE